MDPDKAKPVVRRGRKATGLGRTKTAGLPKDDSLGMPGFFFLRYIWQQWNMKMQRPLSLTMRAIFRWTMEKGIP
jgi:hypothetical protein